MTGSSATPPPWARRSRPGLDAWEPGPQFRVYPALKALTLDLATQVFMGGAELAIARRARPGQPRPSSPASRPPPASSATRCPGTRWGRAMRGRHAARGLPRPARRCQACERRRRPVLGAVLPARRRRGGALRPRRRQPHDLPADGRARHLDHHRHHDDAPPRRAPAVASTAPRRRCRTCPTRPSLDELDALESFDLVMKECLRLVPPVPVLARRSVKETEVLGVRDPRRPAGRRDAPPGPPHGGVLAAARGLRPDAVRQPSPRGQGAPATPGSPSAAGCTSAWGWPSPAPR